MSTQQPNQDNDNSHEQEQEFTHSRDQDYQDDYEDDDGEGTPNDDLVSPTQGKGSSKPVKRAGRRKINIEFIKDKSRRHITFSKRKAGIMKKAYELSTLTGTQVLLLVASETGHVYTFATPKLQPLITKTEGKNLIQQCLNSPDPAPDQQGGQDDVGGGQPLSSYQQHQREHEPLEDDRKPKRIKTELKTTQYSPAPAAPQPAYHAHHPAAAAHHHHLHAHHHLSSPHSSQPSPQSSAPTPVSYEMNYPQMPSPSPTPQYNYMHSATGGMPMGLAQQRLGPPPGVGYYAPQGSQQGLPGMYGAPQQTGNGAAAHQKLTINSQGTPSPHYVPPQGNPFVMAPPMSATPTPSQQSQNSQGPLQEYQKQ